MNQKQIEWIFRQAAIMFAKYNEVEKTDAVCVEITEYIADIVDKSKGNELCRSILQTVAEHWDKEERGRIKDA